MKSGLITRNIQLTRSRLRSLQAKGFVVTPNGNQGRKAVKTVLTGYTGIIDSLLKKRVTNSTVIFTRLKELGCSGGLTQVKVYIHAHKYLVPAKRRATVPKGTRGRRYLTAPGEAFQMDWGFVNAEMADGGSTRIACFVMVCHHCGAVYIELFPNAKQENLFIGMIHAFQHLGIPRYVLTDNMKSVVIRRENGTHPVWQKDYELFMNNLGFDTKLCKPRHPYTKGTVERMVRFVKENFLADRVFTEITDLNYQAERWCSQQNSRYHKTIDAAPHNLHTETCMKHMGELGNEPALYLYLAPLRKVSFDGFVNYEGRRFGVPLAYTGQLCRVMRDGYTLHIYDEHMAHEIVSHDVTWSRRDSFCRDQYAVEEPEEEPTSTVKVQLKQEKQPDHDPWFDQFNLEEGHWNE